MTGGFGWQSVVFGLRACGTTALALGVLLACGCGGGGGKGGGPARYDVSGSVTYAGKPVPAGSITFQPDKAKGNSGPAGFAEIKNGKYDTHSGGKGTIGGPHLVEIAGFDGVKSPGSEQGKELFPEFATTADLPKERTTKDFDVPAAPAEEGGAPRKPAKK